nr:hypothetical protein [Halostagnicola sp. A56]
MISEVSRKLSNRHEDVEVRTGAYFDDPGLDSPDETEPDSFLVVTPERCSRLIDPETRYQIDPSLVFLDEVQNVEDDQRGVLFESIIESLTEFYPEAQIVAAGPYLDNPASTLQSLTGREVGEVTTAFTPILQLKTTIRFISQKTSREFFVRRYSLIISKSVDELQASNSPDALETAWSFWRVTFDRVQESLKTAIEATDGETYSEIISKLTDIHHYDIISPRRQGGVDGSDSEGEFLERKAELGRTIESEVSVLTFVLTGWAFRRYCEGTLSEEQYQDIATTTESQRNSIAAVADVYYDTIRSDGRLGYWVNWNLNEAMAETMGVATSAPAALSWLLSFYCAELLRLGSQSFEGGELALGELPIPVSKAVVSESDRIREELESLQEESIAGALTDAGTNVDGLIDAIVQLHEEAEETYQDQLREDIHEAELDNEEVNAFKQSVQSNFVDSCTVRTVLRDIGIIADGSSEEAVEAESRELGTLRVPRRALVSVDDIPLHLSMQRYVNPIEDSYRDVLFENLDVGRESVTSQEEMLERIREYVDSRDVAAILTTLGSRGESGDECFQCPVSGSDPIQCPTCGWTGAQSEIENTDNGSVCPVCGESVVIE